MSIIYSYFFSHSFFPLTVAISLHHDISFFVFGVLLEFSQMIHFTVFIPLIASNYLDANEFIATKFSVLVQYERKIFSIFSNGGRESQQTFRFICLTKGITTPLSVTTEIHQKCQQKGKR